MVLPKWGNSYALNRYLCQGEGEDPETLKSVLFDSKGNILNLVNVVTRKSPSRLDVSFITLKWDANVKSRQHEHNGTDQETVRICRRLSRNDYVQNNRPQLR